MLIPHKLIEEMATCDGYNKNNDMYFIRYKMCERMLRCILAKIQKGEVVEVSWSKFCDEVTCEGVVLKPKFAKFMEGNSYRTLAEQNMIDDQEIP